MNTVIIIGIIIALIFWISRTIRIAEESGDVIQEGYNPPPKEIKIPKKAPVPKPTNSFTKRSEPINKPKRMVNNKPIKHRGLARKSNPQKKPTKTNRRLAHKSQRSKK